MVNFIWWPTTGDGYLLPAIASVFVGGTPTWGGVGTSEHASVGLGDILEFDQSFAHRRVSEEREGPARRDWRAGSVKRSPQALGRKIGDRLVIFGRHEHRSRRLTPAQEADVAD